MPLRKVLRRLLLLAMLQIGICSGVKISPEEIEKLMDAMHRTQVVQVQKKEGPPET